MTCPLCEREATPEGESHGHGFCVPSRPVPIGNNLQRRQCVWCRGIFTVTIRGKLGRKSDYCKPDCRRLATNKMIAESKRRAALRGHPSPIVDALTDGMFRAAFQATPSVVRAAGVHRRRHRRDPRAGTPPRPLAATRKAVVTEDR